MINTNIQPALLKQLFLILLITGVGAVLFWELRSFLPAVLGAYTLYILMRKWMIHLTKKLAGRKAVAAILLMLLSFIIILVPINALIGILTSKILPYIEQSKNLWQSLETWVHTLEVKYQVTIITKDNLENLGKWGVQELRLVLGATFNSIVTVVVMYFILFFMLISTLQIEKNLYNWIPLSDGNSRLLKKHLNNLIYSNAIGIPLVGLFQGLVALIGYWIAGVEEPIIWFVATCIAAIIPIVGSMVIYIPLSIVLFTQGAIWQSVFLFLYGFLIIGSVDNFFRFWLQRKIGDTHPLITVFGVIIGLNLFGFIGLIFGPILISLFLVLISLYSKEFNLEAEHTPTSNNSD
ncbi:MAG: AI-2E family transporter [Saprospiraceae bacterium]|nr:AI-2E family transporter [Saprospiraceae bacterium]